jgi:hypothetical protein
MTYKTQERVQCECGDSVNVNQYANHIETKKHMNKLNSLLKGLTISDRARIRYQKQPTIECSCGSILKRSYVKRHLSESLDHKKRKNLINVNVLSEFLAFNTPNLKL